MARVATPVKNVPFFLKKITPKFVTEAMNQALPPAEQIHLLQMQRPVEARELYQIFGTIRVATIVPDKSGTKADSVRFSGKFKAYTPPDENGEQFVFESGQAFVPVMDALLYSTLKSAQEADSGAYLEVAFSVGMKPADPTKPSMTGYEWDVQKLITQAPTADDPIERLRLEAKKQALLLEAPKPAATVAATEMPSAADTLKKESAPTAEATSDSAGTSTSTSSETASSTGSSSKRGKHSHASA